MAVRALGPKNDFKQFSDDSDQKTKIMMYKNFMVKKCNVEKKSNVKEKVS